MVRAPPPIASNSAARRLASSKSATALASAVVTAASAAAWVPLFMSLGCLPAKGASRNFSIERPVLLPRMMAMTSLATVVALRWLAGA